MKSYYVDLNTNFLNVGEQVVLFTQGLQHSPWKIPNRERRNDLRAYSRNNASHSRRKTGSTKICLDSETRRSKRSNKIGCK